MLEALLAGRRIAAAVTSAPELLPREAEVAWDQGFDRIDLDACIGEVLAVLAAHLGTEEEDARDERLFG
ncbi:hypothetical protein BH23PSE1_BH23PSE1_13050 [soil metagenome]